MKTQIWILALLAFLKTSALLAQLPDPVRIGRQLGKWQAHKAISTHNGYLIVGKRHAENGSVRLALAGTDHTGAVRWNKSYDQLAGDSEAFDLLSIGPNKVLMTGRLNDQAVLWCIDPNTGKMEGTPYKFGHGQARSIARISKDWFAITIEEPGNIRLVGMNADMTTTWERSYAPMSHSVSSLCPIGNGLFSLAFDNYYTVLSETGKVVAQGNVPGAEWRGNLGRANGELLVFGSYRATGSGMDNPEAFAASVSGESGSSDWFRRYGERGAFEAVYDMVEQPGGRLLMLTKRKTAIYFVELGLNHTIEASICLTDSASDHDYEPVNILDNCGWLNRRAVLYNRSDGTVWVQQTAGNLPAANGEPALSFKLAITNFQLDSVPYRPVDGKPITLELEKQQGLHQYVDFLDTYGEGYAYLFGLNQERNQWVSLGWIKIGSKNPLLLESLVTSGQHLIIVSKRPFADPLTLVGQSFSARLTGRPVSETDDPLGQIPEMPEDAGIQVSCDGTHFSVQHFPPNGYLPILIKTRKQIPPHSQW
ncbi:hypothetical protein LZD49_10005 [Dyadobacter sp. CY261]|uniref:hypothetical protein n=1 Tax=Dyadobacter sp. CY261 TaxID=2907203 RepID=UPI001F30121C|nr:hypothetical protein [Dyadobacter sp. CY261]MCF0070805.1 hypothetical protein [Dyadobacter sp. CY261]